MLKYCCTEAERRGTCYHEFKKGKFDGHFWYKDSLLIHDDILYDLRLGKLFRSVVPSYDEYGETEINMIQWHEIYLKAKKIGGETKLAIDEINKWAESAFRTDNIITILGI